MKLLLALSIISTLLTLGCSTATKPSASSASTATSAKAVKVPVVSLDMDQVSLSLCPKTNGDYTKKPWKGLVSMASSCVRNQSWDRLDEIGHALLEREPFQPWGGYFLSLAAEGKGEFAKARWYIDLALKKNSSYGILFYQNGRLLWQEKLYGEAVSEVSKAVKMDSTLNDAHLFLAEVHFRDQEYDKASEFFYNVLKAKPTHAVALMGLAESRLQRGDHVGALEIFQRGASYHTDRVDFLIRQAFVYETFMNDKVNALNLYIKARKKLASDSGKSQKLSEVELKIQSLEGKSRTPAVSSAAVPATKKEVKR
jgi:tetratricopeptide (TPR) repeat protein